MNSKSQILIEKITLKDIYPMSKLFKKAVNEDYSFYSEYVKKLIIKRYSLKHLFVSYLRGGRIIIIARRDEKIFGNLIAVYTDDGIGFVNWLYVVPQARRQGIARKILAEFEKEVLARGGHKVAITTEIAPKFYQKIGYSLEGILKKHWWGKDFYLFGKLLKK